MTPLLPPAQLTELDWAILMQEWPGRDWLRPRRYPLGSSLHYDRRDADAMRRRERHRCFADADDPTLPPAAFYYPQFYWL